MRLIGFRDSRAGVGPARRQAGGKPLSWARSRRQSRDRAACLSTVLKTWASHASKRPGPERHCRLQRSGATPGSQPSRRALPLATPHSH